VSAASFSQFIESSALAALPLSNLFSTELYFSMCSFIARGTSVLYPSGGLS
jgi:hypothetical protein